MPEAPAQEENQETTEEMVEETTTTSETVAETQAPAEESAEESAEETTQETVEETTQETTAEETSVEETSVDEDDDSDVESATDDDSDDEDEDETSTDDSVQMPFKVADLIEATIKSTSPTQVIVDLGEGYEGVITQRELERMTRQSIEELKEGAPLTVYVVNPHNHRGNTIVSVNRAIEELDWQKAEEYQRSKSVYDAHVAGYNKGGLIVRFGRLRGFVPQSQVSELRRRDMSGSTPEERYGEMVNDTISVKVMEVDRGRNRLILSERAATREIREKLKQELIEKLNVGDVVTGKVVSLEDFGAFVDVGGAEGLVHLTELSWKHVTHPKELLKVGQDVTVEVISIDPQRKRIGLSIKRQEPDPWDEVATTYEQGQLVQGVITKLTKFGAFAQLVEAPDIEGLVHISELSDQRVNHPREVVDVDDKLTLRVVKVDVRNRRLGLSLKKVNSAEFLDKDMLEFMSGNEDTGATPTAAEDNESSDEASEENE